MTVRLSVRLLQLTLSVCWPACSRACVMRAHWWSCVLGLLCMPAEVMLNTETAPSALSLLRSVCKRTDGKFSQSPSTISHMRINSSTEITCSTSLSDALGLYLYRQFHAKKNIVYLSLSKGRVTKNTTSEEFAGRLRITPDERIANGYGFTLRLSPLGLDDTDLYFCQWSHFEPTTSTDEYLSSTGTVIIVRDYGAQEQCEAPVLDGMLIALSVTTFSVTLFIAFGALIFRYKNVNKRKYRPNRRVPPSLPNRPEHVHPHYQQAPHHHHHHHHHHPYMTTSEDSFDYCRHSGMLRC